MKISALLIFFILIALIEIYSNNEFIPNNGRLLYIDSTLATDIKYTYQTSHHLTYLTNNSIDPVIVFLSADKNNELNPNKSKAGRSFGRKKTIEAYRLSIKLLNSNLVDITPLNKNKNYFNYYYPHYQESKVKSFGMLFYSNIYDKIDMKVYTDDENYLEYDFILQPHSDISQIKLFIDEKYYILENGDLQIETPLGYIIQDKPIAFQGDRNIECSFKIVNDYITFEIDDYDESKELIIDPVTRVWGTYYGGLFDDKIYDVKVDDDKMYFSGLTYSPSKIAFNGHQTIYSGESDAFVVKADTNGERIWASYYGGDQFEIAFGVDVDDDENVYIVGEASSETGIATSGAHQELFGGDWADGFIAKFDNDGERLWATYYGGKKDDKFNDLVIDEYGNIYICGYSYSENSIAQNGYKNTLDGEADAILVKFNPLGDLTWGTYYGGDKRDFYNTIAISNEELYIGGVTKSDDNIFYNGYDNSYGGENDGFISMFKTNGDLVWSTYYGGSADDLINGIAILDSNVFFTGTTFSDDAIAYPDTSKNKYGGFDGFIGNYNLVGELQNADFIGGSNNDYFYSIAANESSVYAVGTTKSNDITTSNDAYQKQRYAQFDGVYVRYDKDFNWLESSYFGGLFIDNINAVELEGDYFYLAGSTNSEESMSKNGYQMSIGGQIDGHIQKMLEAKSPEFIFDYNTEFCSNSNLSVSYNYIGDIIDGSSVRLELSDENGDFNTPVIIAVDILKRSENLSDLIGNFDYSENYKFRIYVDSLNKYFYSDNDITIVNGAEILSSSQSVCENSSFEIEAKRTPNSEYKWRLINDEKSLDSIVSELRNNSIKIQDAGNYKLILEQNYRNICISFDTLEIIINKKTSVEIEGEIDVCFSKQYTYKLIDKDNNENISNIIWDANGSSIISENGMDSVIVIWAENKTKKLTVSIENNNGCTSRAELNINPYDALDLTIRGVEMSCDECIEEYFVDVENGTFEWTVIDAEIIDGQGSNRVKVKWQKADLNTLEVIHTSEQLCRASYLKQVEISDKRIVNISGKNRVCLNSVVTYLTSSDTSLINSWEIDTNYGKIIEQTFMSIDVEWKQVGETSIKLVQEIDGKFKDSINYNIEIFDISKQDIAFDEDYICLGDTVMVKLGEELFSNYEWEVNNAEIIEVNQLGALIYFNKLGEISIEIEGKEHKITVCNYKYTFKINVNEMPEKPIISMDGSKFTSSVEEGNVWYRDGIKIENENNKVYEPEERGFYSLKVISIFGCESEISEEVYFSPNSVLEYSENILVYPQPARNILIIKLRNKEEQEFTHTQLIESISLLNINGEILFQKSGLNKEEYKVDLTNIESGLYLLEISLNNGLIYKKISIVK